MSKKGRLTAAKRRPQGRRYRLSIEERSKLFGRTLERQSEREANPLPAQAAADRPWKPHEIARGWRREDLYDRGRSH